MAAVSVGTLLVADRARMTRRRVELLFLWVLVIVFANALWILPLIVFFLIRCRPRRTTSSTACTNRSPSDGADGLDREQRAPFGGVRALRMAREERIATAAPSGVSMLVMLVFAAFGTHLPA
jgi:hypothetical protein